METVKQFDDISSECFNVPISELNLPKVVCIDEGKALGEVVGVLQTKKIGSILIEKNDKLTGILTERDFLLKIVGVLENWEEITIKEVMTPNPFTITLGTSVKDCIKIVSRKEFRHIPVVDDSGKPIHMVSISDLLNFVTDFFPNNVKVFGTIVDWDFIQVDDYGEDFSFQSKEDGKFSGSIFMTALKRVVLQESLKMDLSSSLQDVLSAMQERRRGSVLITEYETNLLGVITERDFLFKILGKVDLDGPALPVKDFMTASPHTLLSKHYVAHAINNMSHFGYRNIIMVNEDRFPIAVIGLLDIFKYIADYLYMDDDA